MQNTVACIKKASCIRTLLRPFKATYLPYINTNNNQISLYETVSLIDAIYLYQTVSLSEAAYLYQTVSLSEAVYL